MQRISQPGCAVVNRAVFVKAAGLASPIIIGYIPIGVAYGILGAQAGLPLWAVLGMSLLVFAGSSQFIAVGMLQAGAPWPVITVTTFLVNLRHLLMSTALVPHVRNVPIPRLLLLAFGVTDESFAVNSAQFRAGKHGVGSSLVISYLGYVTWAVASGVGFILGDYISDPLRFGVDFALPSMFIGLLFLQLRHRLQYGVLLVSGLLASVFHWLGIGPWAVILAATLGAAVGAFAHRRLPEEEQEVGEAGILERD